jgi:hypothetical protein
MGTPNITPEIAQRQLDRLKAGERIITNDIELEAIFELPGDDWKYIRSLPNPERCGIWDQYVAWIGEGCEYNDKQECKMVRERAVAGVSNEIPKCPVHGDWEVS